MNRTDVIGFLGILDEQLPITIDLVGLSANESHVLEPIGRELFRQIAEMLFERRAVIVKIHEQKTAPSVNLDRAQTIIGLVEADRLLHLGRAAQIAVQLESPAVIGAHDQFAIALALQQLRAAMPTGIGKGANDAILIAQDDQRYAGEIQREIIAGICDLS